MMAEEFEIEEPQLETEQNDPLGILTPKKQTAQQADPLGILKKKVDGNVSTSGILNTVPSPSTSISADKGAIFADNSFFKQIGQEPSPELQTRHDEILQRQKQLNAQPKNPTPLQRFDNMAAPILGFNRDLVQSISPKKRAEIDHDINGHWGNIIQNVFAKLEKAGTDIAHGALSMVEDYEGAKSPVKFGVSPLSGLIAGLNGNKQRMEAVIANNPLPNTFLGNTVNSLASIAPDIAGATLAPEVKVAQGAGLLAKAGGLLFNKFTNYLIGKEAATQYGEAKERGATIPQATVAAAKGAASGAKTGIELAILGAGSGLATKSIMKGAEKAGLTGAKGLATKELVNLGTDLVAYSLVQPTISAAEEGRFPTMKEIADGAGIAAAFRIKGGIENINTAAKLNKAIQETQNQRQGAAISNFVDADHESIKEVYNQPETAQELNLQALEAAKKAKETTDLSKKQEYVAKAITLTKASNVKSVAEMIVNNPEALEEFKNSNLPEQVKTQFLQKAAEVTSLLQSEGQNTENQSNDRIFTTLQQMQKESRSLVGSEAMPDLSQRIYEELEKQIPADANNRGEIQKRLQEKIEMVFGRGNDTERTMRGMSESELRNASRRLYESIGSELVVPSTPQASSSKGAVGKETATGEQNQTEIGATANPVRGKTDYGISPTRITKSEEPLPSTEKVEIEKNNDPELNSVIHKIEDYEILRNYNIFNKRQFAKELGFETIQNDKKERIKYLKYRNEYLDAVMTKLDFDKEAGNSNAWHELYEKLEDEYDSNISELKSFGEIESKELPSTVKSEGGVENYNGIFSNKVSSISNKGKGTKELLYPSDTRKIVMMTPDNYLRLVREGLKGNIISRLKELNAPKDVIEKNERELREGVDENLNDKSKKNINDAVKSGEKIDMPFIFYNENGKMVDQDGRNRAAYAREIGEKSIPVLVENLPIKNESIKDKVQYPTETKSTPITEVSEVKPTTEEGTGEKPPIEPPKPPIEPPVTDTQLTEPELTGVSHAETDKVARELGLPEYEKNPETVEEWDAEADKRIKNDPDSISKLLGKLKKDEQPDKIEQRMMAKYLASLKAKIEKEPTNDALINDYKTAKELSDKIGGREVAKSLRARQDLIPVEDSIGDLMVREMETLGVYKLTDKQKEDVVKDYQELKAAKEQSEAKLKILEDENAKLKAEAELKKTAKTTPSTKKSKEDISKVRQDIKASIKDKWKNAGNDNTLTAVPIPYAKQLAAIAPDVAKLVKSYVEEGVTELKDVVKRVVEDIREFIPEFTERDAHDIIRGEYTERKPTRNELAAKLKDLKDESIAIGKLEKLNAGEEPTSEKKKIERNQQITELRKQIKEHDVTKLSDIKKRSEKEAKEVQEKINKGEYAPEPKKQTNILEDKELQKKYPKLYKEALDAKDRLIKLKQEREIKFLKQQYANRSRSDKAKDTALEVLNVPRSLMSSFDFSAPLRQGVIPTIAHPKLALKAAGTMFQNAFSQKKFDRYFSDLRETPEFKVMDKAGLYVADPHDHKLSAKEELFMNNLAEKIPLVGKIVKGSERAYVSYLNKMRIDIFKKGADLLAQSGKTPENSPESYKGLASWVNNSTGRGGMTEKLENAAPILNSLFFSPRLIASRLNVLGLSDIATGGKGFYSKLPKEIRKMVAHDLVSFVGFGAIVLALAKLNGADVETDPRSSDFGKIKVGDTRYDIWGGFQQYIRLIAQLGSGKQKAATTGRVKELNGKDRFGKTRADVAQSFFRGKLAPVPSMIWNFASGRTPTGEKVTVKDELLDHFTPLIRNDIQEAWKKQGPLSIATVGLPATFGIGVQTFDNSKKK